MEIHSYARPDLLAGKTLLYLHGFASSGASGSAKTLRVLLPSARVLAPDLPVEPEEALAFLQDLCARAHPDLVVGASMGGMYAELLYGIPRILVNPAFELADTLLKNNGLGRQEFHNPRADGQTSFLVTKSLLEHFRAVSGQCFSRAAEDAGLVYGLFGKHDRLVDTFGLFSSHYPQAIRFDGDHYLNDEAVLYAVLPVVQWISDALDGRTRPVLFICLSDRIVHHSSGLPKACRLLSRSYDLRVAALPPYNAPQQWAETVRWCEENLGVPVWNRVVLTPRKNLLLGDYLIDAEPDRDGAADFMGTVIPFGSDTFRTWEEVLTYFVRLGGQ